ncbi:YqhA family protein [Shimia sp.]|uniref:YqhA family protein n=1 Tax=Shimia sp. TaxID=1954381 RepID=UPI003296D7BD
MSGEFEKTVHHGIAATRWLLAPMYLGLALMLIVLLVQFVRDFFNGLPELFQMNAVDTLIPILSLGLVLVAAQAVLLLLHTGYQIFLPGLAPDAEPEDGRGRVDFVALRNRLLGVSMVFALLLILQKLIAQVNQGEAPKLQALWPVASVLSMLLFAALVLAVADWFTALAHRKSQ